MGDKFNNSETVSKHNILTLTQLIQHNAGFIYPIASGSVWGVQSLQLNKQHMDYTARVV